MIPKIIHYCWYGNEDNQSDLIKRCIDSWKRYMPDWKIIKWDESNSDLKNSEFAISMLKQKKYAFVSDYVRLKALEEFGGVYLDTDVEVYKGFDELLNAEAFWGFMWDCMVSTAVIGANQFNNNIKKLVKMYEDGTISNPVVNNEIITDFLVTTYPNMKFNNTKQELENNIYIYPKEYFEFPTKKKNLAYSRHWYNQSWKKEKSTPKVKRIIRKIVGDPIYFKLNHDINLVRNSKYYEKYLQDKK